MIFALVTLPFTLLSSWLNLNFNDVIKCPYNLINMIKQELVINSQEHD